MYIFFFKFLENKNNTFIFEIGDLPQASLIKTEILLSLLPILKSWSGQNLATDFVIYGIRRYTRGAWMASIFLIPSLPKSEENFLPTQTLVSNKFSMKSLEGSYFM